MSPSRTIDEVELKNLDGKDFLEAVYVIIWSQYLQPRKNKRRHERNNKHKEQKRWFLPSLSPKIPL